MAIGNGDRQPPMTRSPVPQPTHRVGIESAEDEGFVWASATWQDPPRADPAPALGRRRSAGNPSSRLTSNTEISETPGSGERKATPHSMCGYARAVLLARTTNAAPSSRMAIAA